MFKSINSFADPTTVTPVDVRPAFSIPHNSQLIEYHQLTNLQPTINPISDPMDRGRIEKFLKHVMIENRGIFTLLGSKPMTAFSFTPLIDDEEKGAIYSAQSEQFKKHIALKKFTPNRLDQKQLWKDWRKVEKKYLGKQFLFVEYEKWESGVFINIPAVVFVFKKYYDEFVKTTGHQFDPYTAVYKIGNSADPFWRKVEKNHYLMGLLLGFGEKNSRFFQWESDTKMFCQRSASVLDKKTNINPTHLRVEDLTVPPFITYGLIDDQVEKYKGEREKIIQFYKDKDFTELTLLILKH